MTRRTCGTTIRRAGTTPDALEEGARRMGATKAGDSTERDPDPTGDHAPEALDDAAEKMGVNPE